MEEEREKIGHRIATILILIMPLFQFLSGCGPTAGRGETTAAKEGKASDTLPIFITNPLASFTYEAVPGEKRLTLSSRKLKQANHKRATYYYDLGLFYLKYKEDDHRALEVLLKAVHFEPGFSLANLKISQILLMKRYYLASYEFVTRAAIKNPYNEDIRFTKSAVKMEYHKYHSLLYKLHRRQKSEPNNKELLTKIENIKKMFLPSNSVFRQLKLKIPTDIWVSLDLETLENEEYHIATDKEIAERRERLQKEAKAALDVLSRKLDAAGTSGESSIEPPTQETAK